MDDCTNAEQVLAEKRDDIFVRAHTSVRTKDQRDRRRSRKWPRYCLIFDTETTLHPAQQLNFGVYRRCELVGDKYQCQAEGIFYRDDLPESKIKLLQKYKRNPKTLPSLMFPAQLELGLITRSSFVNRVFWKSVRNGE